jgi:hypothetical protein
MIDHLKLKPARLFLTSSAVPPADPEVNSPPLSDDTLREEDMSELRRDFCLNFPKTTIVPSPPPAPTYAPAPLYVPPASSAPPYVPPVPPEDPIFPQLILDFKTWCRSR